MSERQKVSDNLPTVFIHSSFRTGSTWLWSKFRENPSCYCYYEVFNEILGEISFRNILQSATDWNSHHPRGAPYFSEFSPLLDQSEGIAGFDQGMALTDFFLSSEGDSDRVRQTEVYLASLVKLAQHNKRAPVLSCTRSIGRAKLIREAIGGTHILIRRRLLNQWFSYSNQKMNNNPFFFNTIIGTVNARDSDSFITILANFLRDNGIHENSFGEDHDNLLIVFLCLHLYLYAKYQKEFDAILYLREESSRSDLDAGANLIAEVAEIHVDLSDFNETISAPEKLIRDPDRVFSMVRSLFATPILGIDDYDVRSFVDDELADFKHGYEEYRRVAGSAHAQLEAYAIDCSQREIACKTAADEIAAINRSAKQQADELRTLLEASTGDLTTISGKFKEAELRMQQERALFGEQSSRAAGRLLEIEADLARTINARDALKRDVQQATDRGAELTTRLETTTAELSVVTEQLREIKLAMQKERAEFSDKTSLMADRFQDLEAKLQSSITEREALQDDLQQALEREAELNARLAVTMDELPKLTSQVRQAELVLDQERAEKELAWAKLDYVSTGKAKAHEDLERRWDAMIKKIR